jgi:hypothetical protein
MLARFMATPHYTYLVLKMPAPKGVLTVHGDLLISFKCDNKALEITTTNACFGASAVMVAEAKKVDPSDLTIPEQKRTKTALDAMPATKTMGRNRNSRSPVSSGTTLTYSHGPHRIC